MWILMSDLLEIMDTETEKLKIKWIEYIQEGTNVRPLAPVTIMSKVAKGSSYPDTPLIDTGEMISSIGSESIMLDERTVQGSIFATDPKFEWHEYGLGVPERPTLRPVFDTHSDAAVLRIFDSYFEIVKDRFIRG